MDLDYSLVLRLISTTQPRNIHHTNQKFYIMKFLISELDLQEKNARYHEGSFELDSTKRH